MGQGLTDAVEIAVGLACLAGVVGLRRAPGRPWLAALLAVAGAAAVVHGILSLAS
jgi:hypothetical protein